VDEEEEEPPKEKRRKCDEIKSEANISNFFGFQNK